MEFTNAEHEEVQNGKEDITKQLEETEAGKETLKTSTKSLKLARRT